MSRLFTEGIPAELISRYISLALYLEGKLKKTTVVGMPLTVKASVKKMYFMSPGADIEKILKT